MAKMKTAVDSWRKPLFDNLLRGIRLRSSVYFRPEFRARRRVGRPFGLFKRMPGVRKMWSKGRNV